MKSLVSGDPFRAAPKPVFAAAILFAALLTSFCGGGSSPTPPPAIASVSVSPSTAIVATGNTVAFTAAVAGTGSYSSGVVWSASAGAISAAGVFTAPAAAGTATIHATSTEDPSKMGTAIVTVVNPLTLSISAASPTVNVGGTVGLTAQVSGGTGHGIVEWSLGSASDGSISPLSGWAATLSIPASLAPFTPVTVIATASDPSGSAGASTTLLAEPAVGAGPAVSVVVTTDDRRNLMSSAAAAGFSVAPAAGKVVIVDETQTYQPIEGFGAAFTDSAAYLLHEVAQPAQLASAMRALFTRNGGGIGLSFMRNPIGASDLARSVYSFDDNGAINGVGGAPDLSLANFSIAHDRADIIPIIQQARSLNPQLKIMANPWSPPAWMKNPPAGQTVPTMDGGSLNPGMAAPFANYFVKYIQAYAAAGIPIAYITLQNEPLYDTASSSAPYPGMLLDAATAASVLNQYLLPAFSAQNIHAKVLVYDHNWDQPSYPESVLAATPSQNLGWIAGVAWHGYGGPPGAMTTLFNLYPSLGEYETEHSGGAWVADQVKSDFEEIIQVMRNYGSSYVKWSLALDQNLGPHTGGCATCTPLVTVNSSTGGIAYDVEFYTLGQFSKYVLPGALRIYSSDAEGIVSAAFLNPDRSKALVVFNDSAAAQTFRVQWGGESFAYALPSLAAATFTWSGTPISSSPPYTVSAVSQIQASSYSSLSGLQTETAAGGEGGYDLGYAGAGSWAVYKYVDFASGVGGVSARLACDGSNGGHCGGTLEFHLDSAAGPLIAALAIPSTGGWQNWQTVSAAAAGASGVHDLYVVFQPPASGTDALGNLKWFQFR